MVRVMPDGRLKKYNWERVAVDYCSGLMTGKDCAKKHNMTYQYLARMAKKFGWKKDVAEQVAVITDHKIDEMTMVAMLERHETKSEREKKNFAFSVSNVLATAAATINAKHQEDLVDATDRGRRLRTKFDQVLVEAEDLRGLTTAVVAYKTMTETLIKLIDIERKVYRIERDDTSISSIEEFLKKNA